LASAEKHASLRARHAHLHPSFTDRANIPPCRTNERSNPMTDDAFPSAGRIPSPASSVAGRIALKRAALTVGAALAGIYGLGAAGTYSPEDPSLNVATDGPTHNLFGGPGAFLADMACQTLGAAAPLAFGALFAAGALRIARKRLVSRIDRMRLLSGVAGV